MKINGKEYAVGEIVPAEAVKTANPEFYAAAEAFRAAPYASETHRLTDAFTMLGFVLTDSRADKPFDYDAEQKRLKAVAKKGEIIVFGDEYIADKKFKGQYFVAQCTGLARKRHPEADEEIRIQDAEYRYNLGCNVPFTREAR